MTAGDVSAASKKRLARHAAKFLKSLEFEEQQHNHECIGSVVIDDASAMKESVSSITLSSSEKSSCAYVAGWLEGKCDELAFTDDDPLVTSEVKNFIEEVSRGCLKIPHECTYQLVELGLCFVKKARHRACCCRRLSSVLSTMGYFYNLRNIVTCRKLLWHLSNVLLHGLHNLEKDHQKKKIGASSNLNQEGLHVRLIESSRM